MNRFAKLLLRVSFLVTAIIVMQRAACASVDDAQSFALQAAEPYVKQGFQVREDYWGGDLASGERKAVRLRTSFQRPPAVTLSSSAWRNRQRNARIGRWCMVSVRARFVALRLGQIAIGKDADATN